MPNEQNRRPSKVTPQPGGRSIRRKPGQEQSQTVIIPQLSPEVLEKARRAAAEGKTPQQVEQETVAAAEQAARERAAQQTPPAAKPAQPAQKKPARKTRQEAEEELYQSIHDDHLWLNNPVMVRGLGLAPIVAMAINGSYAMMLCAAAVLLLTATRVLAVAVCHLTGNRFRALVYAFSAALVYIPAYLILYQWFGSDLALLGVYLPMMVVEPVIIKRMASTTRWGCASPSCWWGPCGSCWAAVPPSAAPSSPSLRCRWRPSRRAVSCCWASWRRCGPRWAGPMSTTSRRRCVTCMLTASTELTVLQGVAEFVFYAVLAVFAENVVFSRSMGVSRLIKLVNDPEIHTWQYCTPVIFVQLCSAPLGWLAATYLQPVLRPLIYLTMAAVAMAVVWLFLGLVPSAWRVPCREQLPMATCTCSVLGTMLLCANQNYTLLQSTGFGLGSGLGYLFAVLVVDEGRRRLGSKDVPAIFRGLPSSLIYIGVLSLALYALVGR